MVRIDQVTRHLQHQVSFNVGKFLISIEIYFLILGSPGWISNWQYHQDVGMLWADAIRAVTGKNYIVGKDLHFNLNLNLNAY